jgi:AcrR family transcriptional regulator
VQEKVVFWNSLISILRIMPRNAIETQKRILTAAYRLFYKRGFARVSMDAVAEASGVTKRSVYYHFESKDALVAAVLQNQQSHALALVESWGNKPAVSPAKFLSNLFLELERWTTGAHWRGSGYTRLTMELADLPGHPARKAARQHKRAVEDWLAVKLSDLGALHPERLARETMLLIEGSLSLILIHGEAGYASAAAKVAEKLAGKDFR